MNEFNFFVFSLLQCPKLATKLIGFVLCYRQYHIAINFNPNFRICFAAATHNLVVFCCGVAHRHSSGCDGSRGGFLSASFCYTTIKW